MRRGTIGSGLLVLVVLAAGAALALWKRSSLRAESAAQAEQQEPVEAVRVALAAERPYARTTTAIGTLRALRSITLRNELSGTVRDVALEPGAVVEAGTLLVALDVSVEEAELAAQQARKALAETLLGRLQRAQEKNGASEADVDRARAELDVARAELERTRAVIERKTLRAPFRARVGLADVHVGQYLNEGTVLTTLQGLDDAVHVDFHVTQRVAEALAPGVPIEVDTGGETLTATVEALDARVDPATRNELVRARLDDAAAAPPPGAAVRVRVPLGPPRPTVTVPVSALRRGPEGDHVFVVAPDPGGRPRAHLRRVEAGEMLGDDVVIREGLAAGEQVAAAGSFKLREGVLLAVVPTEDDGSAAAAR